MPPCLIKVVGNWPEKLITKIVWPYTDIITFLTCVKTSRGSRGRDRMVVGFTTTSAISAYHHCYCEFESPPWRGLQHYVIKFDSDFGQVGSSGFLHQ